MILIGAALFAAVVVGAGTQHAPGGPMRALVIVAVICAFGFGWWWGKKHAQASAFAAAFARADARAEARAKARAQSLASSQVVVNVGGVESGLYRQDAIEDGLADDLQLEFEGSEEFDAAEALDAARAEALGAPNDPPSVYPALVAKAFEELEEYHKTDK